MNNNDNSRAKLLQQLRDPHTEIWSIIAELADKDEGDLRRILRPHAEASFDWCNEGDIIDLRKRLDDALDALTLLEIGYELRIVNRDDVETPNLEHLIKLFASQAMWLYASAYSYFGIRFLAGRVAAPSWFDPTKRPTEEQTRKNQLTENKRVFPLAKPPDLQSANLNQFDEFLQLPEDPAIEAALDFLDDFSPAPKGAEAAEEQHSEQSKGWKSAGQLCEPEQLELWLRGLRPEIDTATKERFESIKQGLSEWASQRAAFYKEFNVLEEQANPAAARFALADIYWIARLFRADVSPSGEITYSRSNWLHLLRFHELLTSKVEESQRSQEVKNLKDDEDVLRSVLDFVGDLIQNAAEITSEAELAAFAPEEIPTAPDVTVKWRTVFEEELNEITQERSGRRYQPPSTTNISSCYDDDGHRKCQVKWRERIETGRQPRNLIGLALSGGGIRSATFALGVLQGLQELDLLRYVDYLSTVSGGGFIGSWLIGNVRRTTHWLGRQTSWDQSIAHLRRYSSYLSPKTGILSSDTWTMWASWSRNAFLIQLTGLAWLLTILLAALAGQEVFSGFGKLVPLTPPPVPALTASTWKSADLMWKFRAIVSEISVTTGVLTGLAAAMVLWTLVYNLDDRVVTGATKPVSKTTAYLLAMVPARIRGNLLEKSKSTGDYAGKPYSGHAVRMLAVLPAWVGGFLLASLFWADASVLDRYGLDSYSDILLNAWARWSVAIVLLLVAFFTIVRKTVSEKHRWFSWWVSPLCVLALYLLLCGIERVFVAWQEPQADWYAYVLGPPMVLASFTVSVILFIGFCGRYSNESLREWWTRFGTWLSIFGASYLFVTTAAVFGPPWMLALFSKAPSYIKWPAVAGWAGSVLSGLLAGKSSKTNGTKSKSPALESVAKAGGLLFILGAILGTATLLYVILFNIGTNCQYLGDYWNAIPEIPWWLKPVALAIALGCGWLFSWFFEINIFGLNQFYRNRLVRCYLGATRWTPGLRDPQPFTKFDGHDDLPLSCLTTAKSHPDNQFRGPFPILNCALNLAGSSDLSIHTRHSASFSLTPLRCGADRLRVGYAPTLWKTTEKFPCGEAEFSGGVKLGQAVSISGAAASPNMGYNTSPLVAFLLTMFNVRLGWWFPNPGRDKWCHPGLQFSLLYLAMELFGVADERDRFINVSDGGHFENLGIYELVRRRCKVIIAVDGECDEELTFGSLGNVVRLCDTDFGAKIDLDVSSIRKQKDDLSRGHCAVGTITYSNGSIGYLIYLKASITGDEDIGVAQYRSVHPSFPHETTADQFFTEDQFESYRRLGHHVVLHSLRGTQPGANPQTMAERLYYVLTPMATTSENFLKHSKALDKIWEHFRRTPALNGFLDELVLISSAPKPASPVVQLADEELSIGLEIIQLMENVFLDLRLDDFWEHPDNRGWAILFMRWARSRRFRMIWEKTRRTFGIRFEYFCAARLGLTRDEPPVRV